jgi:hypothetical protein
MAVDTKHSEYHEYYEIWERCEHAAEGQDEIHEYGVKYLPRLSGQTDAEYHAYKQRALYYNATARTIDGLTGMIFLKPEVITAPAAMDNIIADVTMGGLSLHQFAEMVAEEVITIGRCGVLVDYPPIVNAVTLAQAQAQGARPYATMYDAESIINWKTGRINNVEQLTLVVLEEEYEVEGDEFESKCEPQWRVLDLGDGGIYRQRVFRKDKRGEFILVDEIYPQINGRPLNKIPFEFFGVRDNSPCVDKPPLLDLVDVNLSHYRTTADYEHGLHFTGLPTPVVTGYYSDDKSASLRIGSGTAWLLPDSQSKAFYLEFTGQGLAELREALRSKEAMMATLGARILAPEKRAAESAQTANIHRSSENSVLASISQSISIGLTHVMEYLRDWSGVTGDVKIELNRDFIPNSMTAQDLDSLVKAWQSGSISHQTLFDNLVAGDIIMQDVSFDDEMERIATMPATGGLL